jgi:hypothetical protein
VGRARSARALSPRCAHSRWWFRGFRLQREPPSAVDSVQPVHGRTVPRKRAQGSIMSQARPTRADDRETPSGKKGKPQGGWPARGAHPGRIHGILNALAGLGLRRKKGSPTPRAVEECFPRTGPTAGSPAAAEPTDGVVPHSGICPAPPKFCAQPQCCLAGGRLSGRRRGRGIESPSALLIGETRRPLPSGRRPTETGGHL